MMRLGRLIGLAILLSQRAYATHSLTFAFRDPETGKTLVRGVEEIREHGTSLIGTARYDGLDGKTVLTESFATNSRNGQFISYSATNSQTGEQTEVTDHNERKIMDIRYRASAADDWKSSTIPSGPTVVVGKMLPSAILQHWDDLVSGKQLDIDLVVPSMQDTFGFQIQYDATLAKDPGQATFVVEARSWIVRAFAPTLTFTFSRKQDHDIIGFSGPSPVLIDGQKYKAIIAQFDRNAGTAKAGVR